MGVYKGKTCSGGNKSEYLAALKLKEEEKKKDTKPTLKTVVANDDLQSLGQFETTLTNPFKLGQLLEDATKKGAVKIVVALQLYKQLIEDGSALTKNTAIEAIAHAKKLFEDGNFTEIADALRKTDSSGNISAKLQENLDAAIKAYDESGDKDTEESETEAGEIGIIERVFKYFAEDHSRLDTILSSKESQEVLEEVSKKSGQTVEVVTSHIAKQIIIHSIQANDGVLRVLMFEKLYPFMLESDSAEVKQFDLKFKPLGNGGVDFGNGIETEA